MEKLRAYSWPGNIRELQNVIERAVILGKEIIEAGDLPEVVTELSCRRGEVPGENLKDLEREAILRALEKTEGNRRKAAQELGISKRTLQYRLKEYGLVNGR